MKKVNAIRNTITNEILPLDKMEILFVGTDFVMAKIGGFTKVYGKADGYIVVLEKN